MQNDHRKSGIPPWRDNSKLKVIIFVILVTLFVLISGVAGYLYYNLKVPLGKSDQDRFFEIQEGQSTLQIANNLKEKDLVRSPWFFTLYARYKNTNLLPGLYYLRPNMSLLEIADCLAKGNVQEYKITIPEGWTNKQIAEYLEKKSIVKKSDFLTASQEQEGYLFPDTYRISVKSTAQDIVEKMRENFNRRTAELAINKDTVILASLVEKEAKTETDRKIIAGIYLERLKLGMFLESCPTVLYAMDITKEKLSIEDTRFVSSYNTYLHKGLPPGPISNPGLESIKAVLEPTETDYLYFLSDKDGKIHYARTKEEHDLNKQKYGL